METNEKTQSRHAALVYCEGFGVYGPAARIGVVESIRVDTETGAPVLPVVRAGLLGSWLVHVPVDQVQEVSMLERRISLCSGGLLAWPRRAGLASARLCAAPERLEGSRQALGLGSVRRVEVMTLLEDLELEIGEDAAQPLRDLFVLIRVAPRAEGEVDRAIEGGKRVTVDGALVERSQDRPDSGRA